MLGTCRIESARCDFLARCNKAQVLLANPRDLGLQLHIEPRLGCVALMAQKAKITLSVRSSKDQRNDVIELGSQSALSNPALAGLAIVFSLERNTVLDPRRNRGVVILRNPLVNCAGHG